MLGLVRGDWDLVSEGLHDRLHQPRRSPLYPQSMALVRRAQELGALGATISGAGPSVLFWTHYEATGAVMARLRARHGRLGERDAHAVRAAGRGRPRALGGHGADHRQQRAVVVRLLEVRVGLAAELRRSRGC